ncbi:MAG: DUF1549 domain-containing protein [Pirellulaceae bacterium]|nr:DUF1549 domain-containing protein [Pirellulaceae bacterium]
MKTPALPPTIVSGLRLVWLTLAAHSLVLLSVDAADRIEFNRDVRPILSDKCFFCHGPDSGHRQADLRLDVRDDAIAAGAFEPGKPDAAELVRRVLSRDPDEQMPPPGSKLEPLTTKEVETLRQWIASGAEYQPHWAFIPLKPTSLPENSTDTTTKDKVVHPIDRLVRARLAEQGYQPQPAADRTTLIRRLSFDLTGLPPTPAEVQAFINDDSPKAYEKLVDRLLASEHYGERMAVDWLDTARYADSFGFQVDREREMWPWRDWVIKALNSNMPYDRFISWQIAGDLMPDATDEQILATAFNRLHQQESEGGSVEEEYRVEYVCDRVQTFATAFLGLTFECARCHNHKYDPITQADYYGLFGMFHNIDEAGLYSFFTQSPPTPTLTLVDTPTRERLKELEQKVADLVKSSDGLKQSRQAAYQQWLAGLGNQSPEDLRGQLEKSLLVEQLGYFNFDEVKEGKLANALEADKPAKLNGENKLVPGQAGQAIQFTGDDSVDLTIGNFARHEPLSISLWMQTPDEKDRAVVFHRSRAWTDAASRGYELLIEDGRLKWSLIHFWPGNAISIATRDKVPLGQWQHVTVTYDGSSRAAGLAIYVNGQRAVVEVIKDKLTKEITGGGGDNISLAERFRDRGFKGGLIDEFHVFGRQISRLEALALYDLTAAVQIAHEPDSPATDTPATDTRAALLEEHYWQSVDASWVGHLAELEKLRGQSMSAADAVKEIMVMRELEQPKQAYILTRGEYNQRSQPVPAGVPEWLLPLPEGAPKNRLGVAQWLTDPRHPLTARVAVNRLWQSLFGRGLVKTSEDFGSQGSRPLYPEVLDWLAHHLVTHGWDMKDLVKTIVTSETYQQRSWGNVTLMTDDPDNEWLARGSRFRLPAEMIRDNALAAAGLIKHQIGGPPVNPYEMSEAFKPAKPSGGDGVYRRSLYTNWRRTGPPPAMLAFDAPRRAVCIAKRERTDSPLQALIMLNGVQYVEAARVLGESLHKVASGNVRQMIEQGSLRCLSRPADEKEVAILTQLYQEQLTYYQQHPMSADELLKVGTAAREAAIPAPEAAAATILAQALLNHDVCVVKR